MYGDLLTEPALRALLRLIVKPTRYERDAMIEVLRMNHRILT